MESTEASVSRIFNRQHDPEHVRVGFKSAIEKLIVFLKANRKQ